MPVRNIRVSIPLGPIVDIIITFCAVLFACILFLGVNKIKEDVIKNTNAINELRKEQKELSNQFNELLSSPQAINKLNLNRLKK